MFIYLSSMPGGGRFRSRAAPVGVEFCSWAEKVSRAFMLSSVERYYFQPCCQEMIERIERRRGAFPM